MIGFLIGAVCLVGLVKVLRAGRGYGGSCSRRGEGGRWARWSGGHGGHRARIWLRALFERLDTSPGQEKVISAAVEELWEKKRAVKDELHRARESAGKAMRETAFDEGALRDASVRQSTLLVEMHEATIAALRTVHEALDERQRRTLGAILEGTGFGGGWGGPYRGAAWM